MKKPGQSELLLLGVILAFGIAVGGYFIGQTLYNAKVALNTAEVKGLAETRVDADRANWKIEFWVFGKKQRDIPRLYKRSEEDQKIIVQLLKENGFEDSEISIGVLDYRYKEFRDKDQNLVDQNRQLWGSISVETDKVHLVPIARTSLNKLIARGLHIDNNAPTYRFTRLNQIKPDMLRQATMNARVAAEEFAKNAGVTVGGIRNARQGNFSIRDAGEDYQDTTKIEKDVRVVTTITFYLAG
jgi:hypothetical protein